MPQSKAHVLRRLPTIGRMVIEYAYVSGQCRQTVLEEMYNKLTVVNIVPLTLVKCTRVSYSHCPLYKYSAICHM